MLSMRLLPRDEWPKLAGTELEAVWPVLPADAQVVVVEDDGRIVGCWSVFMVPHAEGIWIAPEYRGSGSVMRRLLRSMRTIVAGFGARAFLTAAATPEVADYVTRIGGVELPGRHFVCRIVGVDAKNAPK